MWNVQLYLAVATNRNGKPDQQSGCAIRLEGTNGKATATREITQHLGNKNQPQAEIYAALAALTAIKMRPAIVQLTTSSTYLTKILTKKDGEWGAVEKHQGMVAQLREAFDSHDSSIVCDNCDQIKMLAKQAKASIAGEINSDSGTQLQLV